MACPWFLLKEISLVTGLPVPEEHKILYQLYPDNPSAPVLKAKAKSFVYPADLTHSNIPHSYAADRGLPSTLPFYRTVIIPEPPPTRTTVSDKVRTLYQELSHLPVEYVVCFERIRPIFIVCSNAETARLLLELLPTMKWPSKYVFTADIYAPTYCSLERLHKIEAWSNVSLWVSIDEKHLRLRVRSNEEPFKIFQDLCWQFQVNCHHRSGENDQDKEGETTLWVESSGSKKDFKMPLGKGKQSEKGWPGLGDQRVDRAIGVIQPMIQDLFYKGMTVVGLQLVFVKTQESKDFKKWLIPWESTGSNKEVTNDNRSGEFQYPPLFPVSTMRQARIPVPPGLPSGICHLL